MDGRLEHLVNVYQHTQNGKTQSLEWLKKPPTEMVFWFDKQGNMRFSLDNQKEVAYSFWLKESISALYSYFVENDLAECKNIYFKCGRLTEFLTRKYDSGILTYGRDHAAYVLLSDNKVLIQSFSSLKFTKHEGKTYQEWVEEGSAASMFLIQSIIKDDLVGFEQGLHFFTKYSNKNQKMKLDVVFFEAFANKNKGNMEDILSRFVKTGNHSSRNSDPCISKFISHPAVGYAKLAWLKGIQVEVDSPLIPKEWLPIQPLKDEEYIDYDFVKAYLG